MFDDDDDDLYFILFLDENFIISLFQKGDKKKKKKEKGKKREWKKNENGMKIKRKKQWEKKGIMEMRGIDPRAPRMLSECSTIWATSPFRKKERKKQHIIHKHIYQA